MAVQERRHWKPITDEAPADPIEELRLGNPRPHVLTAYERSHEQYGELYKQVAN